MFLTQTGGLIRGPVSKLLGLILNLFYEAFGHLGVESIGLSIILFTLFVRLILLPSQIKQGKSTKITNYIQPEMKKIAKKYRHKKDQESMMAMQRENKALQEKYGISMASSCLSLIIQMPILFSLIEVIRNIPAYVSKIKDMYIPIADAIVNTEGASEQLKTFIEESGNASLKMVNFNSVSTNTVIDVLDKIPTNMWDSFKESFASFGNVNAMVDANLPAITRANSFIGGIDLTTAPGFALTAAFAIPVLTLIFQFLSMRSTPQQAGDPDDPAQQASMKMMKGMSYFFPFISFITVVNIQAGVGLYWLTSTTIAYLSNVLIRLYFNKCDVEKLVEKSKEKAAKKIAKKKASGKKSFMEKLQEAAYGQQAGAPQGQNNNNNRVNNGAANRNLKNYDSNAINKNNGNTKYRAGSLAAKANAMQRYNDNNGGK